MSPGTIHDFGDRLTGNLNPPAQLGRAHPEHVHVAVKLFARMNGFGVRVYPTGGKVYIAQAREPDGPKRMTVGRHDVLHADQARQRAALIIARIIKAGEEPVPLPLAARVNGGSTVADLAARYLEEHFEVKLKPNTQRQVRGVLRRHVLPALGKRPLVAIDRAQVVDLQQKLCDRPTSSA